MSASESNCDPKGYPGINEVGNLPLPKSPLRGGVHLHVTDAELARGFAEWRRPALHTERGYAKLYIEHVLLADRGVDFDFPAGRSGAPVGRYNH